MAELLSFPAALELVAGRFASLAAPSHERLPLGEVTGRVLAAAVFADRDQPPFHRATRDGYAVRAADLPGQLRLLGAIRAGTRWDGRDLGPGEAIEIMTGAPVPEGADAVLMVEHAALHESTLQPEAHRRLRSGENIVSRGAEVRAGEAVLQSGVRIGPAEIALAASVGAVELEVFRRPTVGVLSTGDELVAAHEAPGPMQIRNSNAPALAALVMQGGGLPRVGAPAADTVEALHASLDALAGADLLLLSGGVSAGRYDLVEQVLLSRGAEMIFTGVRIQPGKPVVFGRLREGTYFFGLPGNPVSTMVTAMLFAMPLLRAMGGEREPRPLFVQAVLTEAVSVKAGLTRFLPAVLEGSAAGATVRPTAWQGSGDLHANARANGYLVVPEDAAGLAAGVTVSVLLR